VHCTHVYICAHECTYICILMSIHMDALYNVISVLESVQISQLGTNKVDYSIQLSHSLCGAVILATCFCCSMTMLVTTCMVVCDLYFVAKSISCMFAYEFCASMYRPVQMVCTCIRTYRDLLVTFYPTSSWSPLFLCKGSPLEVKCHSPPLYIH
jgi:hypothetical protein